MFSGRFAGTTTSVTTLRSSSAITCNAKTQQFPVGLWWRQSDQVPHPTPVEGKNKSDSVTGTLTHVFSPTMTNESVFAYTFVGFPNVFSNPSNVDRKTVGYNDPTLFNNGVAQIPSFGGNEGAGEAALIFKSRRFRSWRTQRGPLRKQIHAERE
jgi:hypothetical protein